MISVIMFVAIFTVIQNATFYCHYGECHHAKCLSATGDPFKKLFLNFSTKKTQKRIFFQKFYEVILYLMNIPQKTFFFTFPFVTVKPWMGFKKISFVNITQG